ncbi:MAG: peptidase [Betaproteobacteria bacterium HGW-Betaproteobacteria-22]|nr:MAG: peptidase [Betaproteobacteria bacterium HGW-Betaproteobacteria-22]
MKKLALLTLVAGTFAASQLHAADAAFPKSKIGLENCLAAALKVRSGEVAKVEYKLENKVPVYEFDIETPDGKAWDVECNGRTGKITEIEEEVANAEDTAFLARRYVSEEDAKATALAAFPGEVIETEYEIEPDGAASYEFDIQTLTGEMKVEVDATTGKIVESSKEIYQIGKE